MCLSVCLSVGLSVCRTHIRIFALLYICTKACDMLVHSHIHMHMYVHGGMMRSHVAHHEAFPCMQIHAHMCEDTEVSSAGKREVVLCLHTHMPTHIMDKCVVCNTCPHAFYEKAYCMCWCMCCSHIVYLYTHHTNNCVRRRAA